jgi:hypothetical protein
MPPLFCPKTTLMRTRMFKSGAGLMATNDGKILPDVLVRRFTKVCYLAGCCEARIWQATFASGAEW